MTYVAQPRKTDASRHDVVVLGAGLCGLSAAYHLDEAGASYTVVERLGEVGGLARTESYAGFSFDHSIHILYTGEPYAAALITDLLGENMGRQARESYCYTAGVYTEYPYQANTYGLPIEIVTENILGLVEAKLAAKRGVDPPANFEEWIIQTFGVGIAKNFMIPYNRRVWVHDLRDMSFHWIAERVPTPSIAEVLSGALAPPEQKYGPNREFWYPHEGGIESLARSFADRLPVGSIELDTTVIGIAQHARELRCADGSTLGYDQLISTLPLPTIVALLTDDVPENVRAAAAGLRHNAVYTVNIGLIGDQLGVNASMHWIYTPEGAVFHRLSFPHRFAPSMAPAGCCSIQTETSVPAGTHIDDSTLIEETLEGLVGMGLITAEEARPTSLGGRVAVAEVLCLNPAYIIYDLAHAENTRVMFEYLNDYGIQSRGRFGEWEYFNMDHSILSGKAAAETALARTRTAA